MNGAAWIESVDGGAPASPPDVSGEYRAKCANCGATYHTCEPGHDVVVFCSQACKDDFVWGLL